MEEKEIVDMVSKESNWEEVLEYVITEEGMEPWDVDIIKLADAFTEHVSKAEELDFKIPARIIIIAAILLRMKTEILIWEEEKKEEEEKEEEDLIDISKVPRLEAPIKRVPRRKVTLDELVGALEKAFRTKEIRERKRFRAKKKVKDLIEEDYIDIDERIESLYSRITTILDRLKKGKITFRELVPKWERREIVENFLPLLHLSNTGKVTCEQKEIFKDIYIKIKE